MEVNIALLISFSLTHTVSLSLSLSFSLPFPSPLPLLQCCIQLAMGKLKPDQLTESVLSLVSARPPQQLTDPSLLAMPDDSQHNRPSAEIIKMMVSLSDRATYAQQCCTTIIVCFRLAVVSSHIIFEGDAILKQSRKMTRGKLEAKCTCDIFVINSRKSLSPSPTFPQLNL